MLLHACSAWQLPVRAGSAELGTAGAVGGSGALGADEPGGSE
jgi:hypothetical protein